jgi:ABC-type antimicrobial peptide transport system permease subunit
LLFIAIGLTIGIGASLILGRFMGKVLYGVSATDPIALMLAVLVLGLTAACACLLPALRATRIDPIITLRE